MENRLTRLFKITIAVFAILLLGVIGGFVTTVGASDIYEDTTVIETENYTVYSFYPDGYRIGQGGELVEFTGTYVLTGDANTNVSFTSNEGESVTYNVILYNWDAYAQGWHGLLSVDGGVTLNLTVHGASRIIAYNHSGITKGYNNWEMSSSVNITVLENSRLEIGYRFNDSQACIHQGITVTLNPEATSSPDISVDGWRNERNVFFTRGNAREHTAEYAYVDESVCSFSCADCQVKLAEAEHKIVASALDSSDENASTKHQASCENCGNDIGLTDHQLECIYENEETHVMSCSECSFKSESIQHNRSESGCTECDSTYIASVTVNGEETNYFIFENAVDAIKASGGVLKLLDDVSFDYRINIEVVGGSATVDLNGFLLEDVRFDIENADLKLTVIDSSQEKTGVLSCYTGYASSCFLGTIEYNGITIRYEFISVDEGTVIFNNVKVIDGRLAIYVQDPTSKVEFTEVYAETEVDIELQLEESYDGNVVFNSGEYSDLSVNAYENHPGGIGVTLLDMLPQGKAFANKDGIVNSRVVTLHTVTVVDHSEHTYDTYLNYGNNHMLSCICGKAEEGAELEPHTINENGVCSVCKTEFAMCVEINGETFYYTEFEFDILSDGSKITLLSNVELNEYYYVDDSKTVTIDLNGFVLYNYYSFVVEYGSTLIIEDSSSEKNGIIRTDSDNSTILGVYGKLVVNSGRIGSIIDVHGSEGEIAEVIINGGKIEARTAFCLYDYSNVTINDAVFSGKYFIENCTSYGDFSISLKGGIFKDGITINGYDGIYLSDFLSSDGCGYYFANDKAEKIELEGTEIGYFGYMQVLHADSVAKSDETGHWFECEDCQLTYNKDSHGNFKYDVASATEHTVVCGICEYELKNESHTGGEANCTELAVCEYCSSEYGSVDSNNHIGGEATCINKAVCERCEAPYGELDESNHETNKTKYAQGENADEHNKLYACCSTIIDTGKHENGVADCTSKAVCTVCNLEYGSEPSGHKYSNNCDASCNVCGEGRQINGHVYDNACDTECNECKATRVITHNYGADGKCLTCDDKIAPQEAPKGTMGTGAIIGIILATVAVFGCGAFSLIWFVLRKKF